MLMRFDPDNPQIHKLAYQLKDESDLSIGRDGKPLDVIIEKLGSNPISISFPTLDNDGVMITVLVDYFNDQLRVFLIDENQVIEGGSDEMQREVSVVSSVANLRNTLAARVTDKEEDQS